MMKRDDVLAYMLFHKRHRSQIRSSASIARSSAAPMSRASSPTRILLEQNDKWAKWAVTRRYMSLETTSGLCNDPAVGDKGHSGHLTIRARHGPDHACGATPPSGALPTSPVTGLVRHLRATLV